MFYEPLKVQNPMCELCMFFQLQSQMMILYSYMQAQYDLVANFQYLMRTGISNDDTGISCVLKIL